jgi:hypothetical protein
MYVLLMIRRHKVLFRGLLSQHSCQVSWKSVGSDVIKTRIRTDYLLIFANDYRDYKHRNSVRISTSMYIPGCVELEKHY